MNVPPIIGAFFIGMILAETNVTNRVQAKLESFKDAFVAIFFTSFGMMIDPSYFDDVLWMVALAVPIVLLYEAFVMSSISYFLGFSAKASTTIGTSMSGRGVESILYASVGSKVEGMTMGAQLNPFAGAFCFAMSAITPPLVKHSAGFAKVLSKVVPRSMRFSGAVVSRTIGKAVLPSSFPLIKGARLTGWLMLSFVAVAAAVLMTSGVAHILATAVGVLLVAAIYYGLRSEIADIARHVNYANIGVFTSDKRVIVELVSYVALSSVASVLLIVATWTYSWQFSLVVSAGYVVSLVVVMFWAYKSLYVPGRDGPSKISHIPRQVSDAAEPIPALPKPVYGGIRASPRDFKL
jgi:CPA2 family monovalent cation:H+ antiporter-2